MRITQRIAYGTVLLTFSNVFVRLLSIFTMPVLTRLLEPNAYGTAAMATTMISLLSVLSLAGADTSYMRATCSKEPVPSKAIEALTWRYTLGVSLLASLVAAGGWQIFAGSLSLPSHLGLLIGAGIVLSATTAMATARARLNDRHSAMSISNAAAGSCAAALSVGLAYMGWHNELPLILSSLVSSLVPVLMLGAPPIADLLKPTGLSFAERWRVLSIGFPIIVTAPAYWVISSSDRWVLGYFHDAATVGIYSVGYSIAIIGMTLNSAVLAIWLPEAAKLFESGDITGVRKLGSITEVMLAVFACTWLAVTAAGGDTVRLLSAPTFHSGTRVIPLIAGAVFFHGVTHLAYTVYFLEKCVYRTTLWWLTGAVASLLLNIALIPALGMLGAAVSQCLTLAIVAVGLSLHARHLLAAHINWRRLLIAVFVIVAAAFVMVAPWAEKPLLSLVLKLPFGVLVAGFVASHFGTAARLRSTPAAVSR